MIICSFIERIIFLSGFDAVISYENFELLSKSKVVGLTILYCRGEVDTPKRVGVA